MKWQPIKTHDGATAEDVLLWNGERVLLGWLSSCSGWHDSTAPDHLDWPIDPQPTHWMPLPEPPR